MNTARRAFALLAALLGLPVLAQTAALQWELNRPGRTWVLGSERACEGEACIGFTYVVCAGPTG